MASHKILLRTLAALKHARVGVIGDAMLDRFVFGDTERISPEAPVLVVTAPHTMNMPGGAANAAANAVSLGCAVDLVGVAGDDTAGDELRAMLKERRIGLEGFLTVPGAITTEKVRVVARHQHVLRIDREHAGEMPVSITRALQAHIASAARHWDAVLVSDYAKGVIQRRWSRQLVKGSKKGGYRIIVDVKPQHARYFKGVYLYKTNLKEARQVTGLHEVRAVGLRIQRIMNCNVLITQGGEGMTLFELGGRIRHIATQVRAVFDVVGAGDTVAAVLAAALAAGARLAQAAELANIAAGIVVEKVGTAVVTPEELKKRITQSRA